MRLFALVLAFSSLALAGCGEKEAAGNTAAVDQAVTAQDFAPNDATAIDAATGADANMAADVDINFTVNETDSGGGSIANASRSAPGPRPRPSEASTAAPANETQAPAPQPATPPAETNTD